METKGPYKGLIVSDIDGTLMPEGGRVLPEALFVEVERLQRAGYAFAPVSGRQFHSARLPFLDMGERLYFVCEGGAVIFAPGGRILGKTAMDRDDALGVIRDILGLDDAEVLISGENTAYVMPKKVDMVHMMRDVRCYNTLVIRDPEEIEEDIVKVAVYTTLGSALLPRWLSEKWRHLNPALSGERWLDFTLADKGTGLRFLAETLGVPLRDTVSFGDQFNDLPMLELAGRGYVMDTARADLLQRVPLHCSDVVEVLRGIE